MAWPEGGASPYAPRASQPLSSAAPGQGSAIAAVGTAASTQSRVRRTGQRLITPWNPHHPEKEHRPAEDGQSSAWGSGTRGFGVKAAGVSASRRSRGGAGARLWKAARLWLASQNGLLALWPQRQRIARPASTSGLPSEW